MNRRGEGTASRLIIVLLLFLGGAMLFSEMITGIVGAYGKSDLPEFEIYDEHFQETQQFSTEFIDTQESTNQSTNPLQTFEDTLFGRGLKTISFIKDSGKIYSKLFTDIKEKLPFTIPDSAWLTIMALMMVMVVILVVKAFWRYDKV